MVPPWGSGCSVSRSEWTALMKTCSPRVPSSDPFPQYQEPLRDMVHAGSTGTAPGDITLGRHTRVG